MMIHSPRVLCVPGLHRYEFHGVMHPPEPQGVIRWCPDVGLLFTASPKGDVTGWDVQQLAAVVKLGVDTVPLRKLDGTVLTGRHKDVVMDIVEVADHKVIVTAGMDKRVALWGYGKEMEPGRLRFQGDLAAFSHGIRQMTYIEVCGEAVGGGASVTAAVCLDAAECCRCADCMGIHVVWLGNPVSHPLTRAHPSLPPLLPPSCRTRTC